MVIIYKISIKGTSIFTTCTVSQLDRFIKESLGWGNKIEEIEIKIDKVIQKQHGHEVCT